MKFGPFQLTFGRTMIATALGIIVGNSVVVVVVVVVAVVVVGRFPPP